VLGGVTIAILMVTGVVALMRRRGTKASSEPAKSSRRGDHGDPPEAP
jgi:hypothetical protein